MANKTMVPATNPVTCGHTINKLCPKGKGVGIAPSTCAIVKAPKLLTEGINSVTVASLNN